MATSKLIEALQELAHERKIDEFYLIERLEESFFSKLMNILSKRRGIASLFVGDKVIQRNRLSLFRIHEHKLLNLNGLQTIRFRPNKSQDAALLR